MILKRIDHIRYLYIPIWGLFLMATWVILYFAQSILIPVFLAIILALLLNPSVTLLCKTGMARPISSALLIITTTSIFILLLSYLSEPTSMWFDRLPTEIRSIENKMSAVKNSIETVKKTTEQISEIAEVTPSAETDSNVVVEGSTIFKQLLQSTQSFMVSVLIFLALLYFSLAFGPQLANNISQLWKQYGYRGNLQRFSQTAQQEISRYLLSITIINISLGIIAGIIMYFLDMPNPLVWGASTAVLNFIPYVGPAINIAIISLVSLLTFDNTFTMVLPPLALLILNIIEGQFIQPSFVGHMLTVNPIIVFLFILFWGSLWGMAGVFMAVPILVILKVIFEKDSESLSNQDSLQQER